MERFCLECGMPISGKEGKKFCSRIHKSRWHNKQRKAEIEGFKVVTEALQRVGYEVRKQTERR